MRPPTLTAALRRPARLRNARFASSTTEAGQKKAQDALSGLGKTAEGVWLKTKTVLGTVGDGIGNLLGAYRQPVVYNLSVTREILKQIYIAESLQPPTSFSVIQNACKTIWSRASGVAFWRQAAANGDLARIGVYALEAYGIFKIGEIIGRRSLVGYNLH